MTKKDYKTLARVFNREQWKLELAKRGFYLAEGSHDDNLANQAYYALITRLFRCISYRDPSFDRDKFLKMTDEIIDEGMA